MRPTTVDATFSTNGDPRPRSLTWEGTMLTVKDIGRRWEDGMGRHMLVHVMDDRVFELVYNGVNWQVDIISQPPKVV